MDGRLVQVPIDVIDVPEEDVKSALAKLFAGSRWSKYRPFLMEVLGAIPWVGTLIAGLAAMSEARQGGKISDLFRQWLEVHEAHLKKLAAALVEITTRLDTFGEDVAERMRSPEFLTLVRKAIHAWDNSDTDAKRKLIQNLLMNAAATRVCSDDVIRLFTDWIETYHEIHFKVIREIYRNPGTTRADIWDSIGSGPVREDSPEADVFKMVVRDLSIGGVIRQPRETNASGEYLKKRNPTRSRPSVMKSAFDDTEPYELTKLGEQFVHYTMNEVVPRIGGSHSSN